MNLSRKVNKLSKVVWDSRVQQVFRKSLAQKKESFSKKYCWYVTNIEVFVYIFKMTSIKLYKPLVKNLVVINKMIITNNGSSMLEIQGTDSPLFINIGSALKVSMSGCFFCLFICLFSIWVFFHNHLQSTELQEKGEGIFLTPHYNFHPLHKHLDISQAITAESSPLHICSSRTRTRNLLFPSASR